MRQARTCITSSSAPCLWLPAALVMIFKSIAPKKIQHSLHDLQRLIVIQLVLLKTGFSILLKAGVLLVSKFGQWTAQKQVDLDQCFYQVGRPLCTMREPDFE